MEARSPGQDDENLATLLGVFRVLLGQFEQLGQNHASWLAACLAQKYGVPDLGGNHRS